MNAQNLCVKLSTCVVRSVGVVRGPKAPERVKWGVARSLQMRAAPGVTPKSGSEPGQAGAPSCGVPLPGPWGPSSWG